MLAGAPRRYPALGPLMGKAFDQAVSITIERWLWLTLATLITVAGAPWGNRWAIFAGFVATALWGILSGAATVRAVRPDFKLTWRRVGLLIGLNITINFFVGLATLALIIPGIYVAVMWSLANVILLLDDVSPAEARRGSWELVAGHFWRTLLLSFCVSLAQLVASFAAQIGIVLGFSYLVQWIPLTQQQIGSFAAALAFPVNGYATAAGWLCYIYWYKALNSMNHSQDPVEEPVLAASPA
jgi:hypothetical protein